MTKICVRLGIGFLEVQASKCPISVCLNNNVTPMRRAGFLVGILQWLKALSIAKCVSTGTLTAVTGLETSGFATAVLFMCTSCHQHTAAICDTVARGTKVGLFLFFLWFFRKLKGPVI